MTQKEISQWHSKIERARSLQQRQHSMWKDSLKLYNCSYFNELYGGYDTERVDVNFANWYIDNLIPLVYFRDPFIFVKPTHSRYSGFAQTLETVVNNAWKKLHLKQQFKRIIKSAFIMPPGWIKTGYTAKIGQDVARQEEYVQKTLIQEIKDTITGVLKKKEPLTPEEQGELNQYIEQESIFANWIPSWNMLMPEGYQLVSQMPYLIEIEDISRMDFYSNPFYKNKDKAKETRNLAVDESGGTYVRKPTYNKLGSTSAGTGDDEFSIIRLYHIWDRRSNKRYALSLESPDPHFVGDWPYDVEGFPYRPLIFDESLPSDSQSNPYPVNVLTPILPQIIEQSQARTQMSKWRKRASVIVLAQRGLLTEEDMKQLEDTEEIQLCYVSNIGGVSMTQTPNLPTGVFDVDDIIKQDLQMATNMGQLMFQAQVGQRTATQAQIGQSGLQLKASARVDVVEDFTVEVAMCIAQLAWQFYDRDKISEITGEAVTEDMWPTLPDDPEQRKRIIRSELQFRIDAGSTAPPKDETVDKKQLLDYASIVANIAPERLKKDEFLKQLTKKFKFIKDVDKIIISNDEGEIKAAQEENQLLQQNIPQVVSPNENHIIHIQQHSQIQQPTDASDLHVTDHAKFAGIEIKGKSGVGNKPQQGDKRPPMASDNPEINRQGIPSPADIMQSSQNMGVSTGNEAI